MDRHQTSVSESHPEGPQPIFLSRLEMNASAIYHTQITFHALLAYINHAQVIPFLGIYTLFIVPGNAELPSLKYLSPFHNRHCVQLKLEQ